MQPRQLEQCPWYAIFAKHRWLLIVLSIWAVLIVAALMLGSATP